MRVKTLTISEKGQIVIPAEVRKSLKLKKGMNLVLAQRGDKILIEKAGELAEGIKENFKDLVKLSEHSLRDIWGGKEEDVWNQYLEAK